MPELTVSEIRKKLKHATADEFAVLERSLIADTRQGVAAALDAARNRIRLQQEEDLRVESLYDFDRGFLPDGKSGYILGLDEVGRGSLAGPLAVGGVVLQLDSRISGLNDSKQVKPETRKVISDEITSHAVASTVQFVSPDIIDAKGIMAALKIAFKSAIEKIEHMGISPSVVLLDGNPMHIDDREVSVVKGDARSASIAAASIIAKVRRDALMVELDAEYPGYGFAQNKGYGTSEHRDALAELGLCAIHRTTYCAGIIQPTLFDIH